MRWPVFPRVAFVGWVDPGPDPGETQRGPSGGCWVSRRKRVYARLRRGMALDPTYEGPSLHQLHVLQRQAAHRLARRRVDRVEDGGRHHADRRLADAAPEIMTRHDDRLDLGHLGEPHDLVAVEVEI